MRLRFAFIPAALAIAAAVVTPITVEAQRGLAINARANFPGGRLRTGFTPDPWGFNLTAGGGSNPIDLRSLGLTDSTTNDNCLGFVTRRPDFRFYFEAGQRFPLARFYVITQNGADATLLVNQPDGSWRCNDDHHHQGWGHNLMPAIDFHNPQSGRYDVWVGTYDASSHNPATLYVTELDSNHP